MVSTPRDACRCSEMAYLEMALAKIFALQWTKTFQIGRLGFVPLNCPKYRSKYSNQLSQSHSFQHSYVTITWLSYSICNDSIWLSYCHSRFNRPPWPKVGNKKLDLLILRVVRFYQNPVDFTNPVMSIPWILVLYKKRKRIAEAVSFLLLVIDSRRSAVKSRR